MPQASLVRFMAIALLLAVAWAAQFFTAYMPAPLGQNIASTGSFVNPLSHVVEMPRYATNRVMTLPHVGRPAARRAVEQSDSNGKTLPVMATYASHGNRPEPYEPIIFWAVPGVAAFWLTGALGAVPVPLTMECLAAAFAIGSAMAISLTRRRVLPLKAT